MILQNLNFYYILYLNKFAFRQEGREVTESVILSLPVAVVLYAAAAFLCLFERLHGATRGVLTYAAGAIVLFTTGYAIFMGASLREAAVVLLAFLIVNMGVKE